MCSLGNERQSHGVIPPPHPFCTCWRKLQPGCTLNISSLSKYDKLSLCHSPSCNLSPPLSRLTCLALASTPWFVMWWIRGVKNQKNKCNSKQKKGMMTPSNEKTSAFPLSWRQSKTGSLIAGEWRLEAPRTLQTELHHRVCFGKFWVPNMSSQITKHTPVFLTTGETRKHISF